MARPWMRYLTTLRRVPDDVILSVATREFDMQSGNDCVCGWVIREALGGMLRRPAENIADYYAAGVTAGLPRATSRTTLSDIYGGEWSDWDDIFIGVTSPYRLPEIERAFVERVKEAAGVA